MIENIEQFLFLIQQDDEESGWRLDNEEASVSTWLQILEANEEFVGYVKLNKKLPVEILRLLASHESSNVRSIIANKRALPNELFETLSEDKVASVRARIACNKKVPLKVLEKLAGDVEPIVSELAQARMEQRKKY